MFEWIIVGLLVSIFLLLFYIFLNFEKRLVAMYIQHDSLKDLLRDIDNSLKSIKNK